MSVRYGERSMKLELAEASLKWKEQHKSNHKKVFSLQVGVEEWEWTDCGKLWLALGAASAVVEKTQQGIQTSKYNNGIGSSIQMSKTVL